MENKIINIAIVAEVAEALKDLRNQMVFVGGAVVSLYTDLNLQQQDSYQKSPIR